MQGKLGFRRREVSKIRAKIGFKPIAEFSCIPFISANAPQISPPSLADLTTHGSGECMGQVSAIEAGRLRANGAGSEKRDCS